MQYMYHTIVCLGCSQAQIGFLQCVIVLSAIDARKPTTQLFIHCYNCRCNLIGANGSKVLQHCRITSLLVCDTIRIQNIPH